MIKLRSVYRDYPFADAIMVLYRLLGQRKPDESISHHAMPSMAEHVAFVISEPYQAWYLILKADDVVVGTIYLTQRREIGVFIGVLWRGQGYGTAAVLALIGRHPGRPFLWNVNPKNQRSQHLAEKLGGRLIQWTYKIPGGWNGHRSEGKKGETGSA